MKSFLQGLTELARIIVLAIISYLLTAGVLVGLVSMFGTQIDAPTQATIIAILTAVLKAVDKWLHEKGKDDDNDSMTKGITRF